MGSELGVSDEKMLALNGYAGSPLYDAKERAALEYADAITLSDRDVDDELFARVRGFFDEEALVELTASLHRLGELVEQVQPRPARPLAGALGTGKGEGAVIPGAGLSVLERSTP